MKLTFAHAALFLITAFCSTARGQMPISSAIEGFDTLQQEGTVQFAGSEQMELYPVAGRPSQAKNQLGFTAELPLLSVYANHGIATNNWFNDLDTTAAIRATATFDTAGILGFRGRYFHFDAKSEAVPATTFQIDMYDLEATTGLEIADWSFVGAGGLRWGNLDFTSRFGGPVQEFEGFGFTVGVDARREIARGFSLYAGVRQSILYGESYSSGLFFGNGKLENVVLPISELRLGTDYTCTLRNGSQIVAGVGYEHQQFSGLSVRNIGIDPEDVDVGLGGPVFSLTWLH